MNNNLTKRELLSEALSDLIAVQIKLENEIRVPNEFYNKKNLPEKLEAVKEIVGSLSHTFDLYFKY